MSAIELSEQTVRLVLELSALRSRHIIGSALASKYPSESDWNAARNEVGFLEELEYFSGVLRDARMRLHTLDPNNVEAIEANYDLALDALEDFASRLSVPVEDLVYTLTSTL